MMAAAIRVLYVDDEPALLDIGKLFLEESGDFTVTIALSAAEGIQLLEQEKFDAIISDYQMPGTDGIQFLVEVRKRFGPVPFILFTGRGREEIVIQAINNGADFYLQKGGDPGAQFAELEHKVRQAATLIRSEDALRETTEYLQNLINYANAPIITWNPALHITRFNHAFEQLTGRTQEEMLGKRLDLLFPEETCNDSMALIQKTLTGEQWQTVEIPILIKDGSIRTVIWNSANLLDNKGRTISTIAQGVDITERKKAEVALQKKTDALLTSLNKLTSSEEELRQTIDDLNRSEQALRESENRYRTLVENIPQKIFLKDLNFRYISVNEKFAHDLGIRPEDMVGKTDADLFPADLAAKYHTGDIRALETGQTEEFDEKYLLKGKETWVHTIKTLVRDKDGKISGILGVFWDITDRKQAEDSLREEQQFSKLILDSLPGIFYLYTYPEHQLTRWNKQHETLLGFSADELKGKLASDWHLPELKDAVLKATQEVMDKGESSVESNLIAKDGHTIPFFLTGVRFEARGRLYYMGIGIDLSERKRAEEAVLHLTKFQESVISNARVWLSVLDPAGKILVWNTAAAEISGYRSEEVIGSNAIWKLLYPEKEYRKQVTTTINRIISEKNYLENFETIIHTKDGNEKIISWNTKGIPDKSGKTADYIVIGMDVTTRHRAEEQLNNTVDELRRFNKLTVDRELRMIALKQEINALLKRTGEPEKYRIGS